MRGRVGMSSLKNHRIVSSIYFYSQKCHKDEKGVLIGPATTGPLAQNLDRKSFGHH